MSINDEVNDELREQSSEKILNVDEPVVIVAASSTPRDPATSAKLAEQVNEVAGKLAVVIAQDNKVSSLRNVETHLQETKAMSAPYAATINTVLESHRLPNLFEQTFPKNMLSQRSSQIGLEEISEVISRHVTVESTQLVTAFKLLAEWPIEQLTQQLAEFENDTLGFISLVFVTLQNTASNLKQALASSANKVYVFEVDGQTKFIDLAKADLSVLDFKTIQQALITPAAKAHLSALRAILQDPQVAARVSCFARGEPYDSTHAPVVRPVTLLELLDSLSSGMWRTHLDTTCAGLKDAIGSWNAQFDAIVGAPCDQGQLDVSAIQACQEANVLALSILDYLATGERFKNFALTSKEALAVIYRLV